jgi:autotransporter-associated beta strand protein
MRKFAMLMTVGLVFFTWGKVEAQTSSYVDWDGSAGDSVWDSASVNWNVSGTEQPWVNGYAPRFNGGNWNITVGDNISLTKTNDDSRVMLFQNSGTYVFSGSAISIDSSTGGDQTIDVLGNSVVTFNNVLTLSTNNGNLRLRPQGGSVINLNGGINIGNQTLQVGWFNTGTINLTGGTYITGEVQRTQNLNVTGSVTFTANGGHNGSNGVTTVNNADAVLSFGGDVNNNKLAQSNNNGGLTMIDGNVTFRNDGLSLMKANNTGSNTATLDMRGGTLTSLGDKGIALINTNEGTAHNGQTVFLQSGGTIITKGIKYGHGGAAADAAVRASVTISGGALYIGDQGIKKGDAVVGLTAAQISFTASGGTIAAIADWSSDVDMKLTGNVTFQASGTNNDQHNITLNGKLSGNGGFAKTGGGTLILAVSNDYTGDTIVSTGVLAANVSGALGGSNVSLLNGARLQLGDALSIGNLSNLSVASGSFVELNFSGTASLGSLFLDGGIIGSLTIGQSYSADDLNSLLGGNIFSGSGMLSIAAIPEPSTYVLLGLGVVILAVGVWRRCVCRG